MWATMDLTALIGTAHYDSDDDAVCKCTSMAEYASDIAVV